MNYYFFYFILGCKVVVGEKCKGLFEKNVRINIGKFLRLGIFVNKIEEAYFFVKRVVVLFV